MWKTGPFARFCSQSSAEAVTAEVPCVDATAAAEAALKEWAFRLQTNSSPKSSSSSPKSSFRHSSRLAETPLVRAVRLVAAAPIGDARDSLLPSLTQQLALALLPETHEVQARNLELLSEAFQSKELVDALVGSLAALARDARLEQQLGRLDGDALLTGFSMPAESADAAQTKLPIARQLSVGSGDALSRCEEVLRLRRLALHQAEMLLEDPRRTALRTAAEAAERQARLDDELADDSHGSALDEGASLEADANGLKSAYWVLRAELDQVSNKVVDCRARQTQHMSQVDAIRVDFEATKAANSNNVLEIRMEAEVSQRRLTSCSDYLHAVRRCDAALEDSNQDTILDTLVENIEKEEAEASRSLRAVADERLAAATARVRCVRAEEAQATQTFKLFDVEVPENVQQNLPKRNLPGLLSELDDAWWAHRQLGFKLDAEALAEVEELLLDAPPVTHAAEALPTPSDRSAPCVTESSHD